MFRLTKILIPLFLIITSRGNCLSLQQVIIRGTVTDTSGQAVENVSITIQGTSAGTYSDRNGIYFMRNSPSRKEYTLVFSHLGFLTEVRTVRGDAQETVVDVILRAETRNAGEVTVSSQRIRGSPELTVIPVKDISFLPGAAGSFEAILKTLPGVSSHNELSSQYSVRGGSYDENLVYVNDMEIFRPFLIRSGKQEGLSFINSDLVSSVQFSSGGFDASYGDRISSVLDIKYRRPVANNASVQLGLLLNSVHFEGIDKSGRFTWMTGARYKSTSMMLKTLDTKGDYLPIFADIQSILNLKTGPGSTLSLLTSFSSNTYKFRPESMLSTFGTQTEAYQLYILFNGGEKDRYSTFNASLGWSFTGEAGGRHKFLLTSYFSDESETFDIRGYYRLDNLDKNTGTENFSDSIMNIGIGSFISHARNKLSAYIGSFRYSGEKTSGDMLFKWGFIFRNDKFSDRIREWKMEDSAGYSIPFNPASLSVSEFLSSGNNIRYWSASSWAVVSGIVNAGNKDITLNAGIRGLYNSFTGELLATPRFTLKMNTSLKTEVWLSGGYYYQPPSYREMRFPDGSLNYKIRTQKSLHLVAGLSYNFTVLDRPFRMTAELFSKKLSDIIPYYMDNVRIIYSGVNSAKGFSRGIDLRLNGEFVGGAESWVSVSVLDSRLKIPGSDYGSFPSPGDQNFSVNIFFQDYFPAYPTLRAHVNIAFATGLPIISPYDERYDRFYRLPAYRRIDLGFTKVIKAGNQTVSSGSFLKFFDELVAGVEIFNLLDINNTVSYFWVRTINNLSGESRQYAIPDYLTGRCLNLRVIAKF